jgi:uncharacterized protein (DUF2384 family)
MNLIIAMSNRIVSRKAMNHLPSGLFSQRLLVVLQSVDSIEKHVKLTKRSGERRKVNDSSDKKNDVEAT